MNRSIIRYILGCVLTVEGLLMLTVCAAALWYGEAQGWTYLAVGVGAALLGLLLISKKPASTVFYLKEGCVSTALSWMLMSILPGRSPALPTRCLRRSPALPPPAPASSPTWRP